jgi:hypothetical protein
MGSSFAQGLPKNLMNEAGLLEVQTGRGNGLARENEH